jgi:hypothetical protein
MDVAADVPHHQCKRVISWLGGGRHVGSCTVQLWLHRLTYARESKHMCYAIGSAAPRQPAFEEF